MKKYSMETAKMYERDIQHFLDQTPNARTALYADVMQYVEKLRKEYPNPRTINRMLYGVKAYYNYLNETKPTRNPSVQEPEAPGCENQTSPAAGPVYRKRTGKPAGQERTL